jgi:periplasmic divalent cation tolerance protein
MLAGMLMACAARARAMVVSVYCTAPGEAEAQRLAEHVLERRLAACANWWPMRSLYWWEGKLEQAGEAALLLKTRADLLPRLVEELKAVHPYSEPCVVAWPVAGGSASYLDWVRAETQGPGQRG